MEVIPTGDLKLTTPPNDRQLEKSVLGVFLLEERSFPMHADKLHEGLFYDLKNRMIFKAIFSLFKTGRDIDLLTVFQELQKSKIDVDPVYLAGLQSGVASSAHLETWILNLQEKFMIREMMKISQWAYYSALDPENDILDIYSKSQAKLSGVLSNNLFVKEKSFGDIIAETVEDIKDAAQNKDGIIGLETNESFIDQNMKGLVAPDLTVIAARPGEGKTTLMWHLVLNLAKKGIPVGVFSYEMKDRQLAWKTLSHYLPETINKIRSGDLSGAQWDDLWNKFNDISGLPIHIHDSGSLNVEQIKAVISSWMVKYDIKAFFIDYLQLVPAIPELRKAIREVQVSYNSRFIKSICMEYDLPGILLSQLSRQGANIEPELHHLRETGAIEQDADNVLFLYRPDDENEQYFPNWQEGDPEWLTYFLLKKCRLGSKGNRKRILNAAHNTFKELEFSEPNIVGYRDPSSPSEPEDVPF